MHNNLATRLPDVLQAGHEYVLQELLQSWGLPDEYHAEMSKEWKCVLARACHTDEEATVAFMKPQPFIAAQSCGQAVLDETGSNVFEYLVNPEWDEFPRPRFAIDVRTCLNSTCATMMAVL
jgi:hypothetical protein